MAWIKTVSPAEASGELTDVYNRMRDPADNVANILQVHSLNLAALRAHFDLYRTLMFGKSELSRAQREMVAVAEYFCGACRLRQ